MKPSWRRFWPFMAFVTFVAIVFYIIVSLLGIPHGLLEAIVVGIFGGVVGIFLVGGSIFE